MWIAGDTDLYPEMADLPALAGRDGIDLAVVPVAGWGPRLSEGHMGPGEAAEACALTRARWTLPVHWGTLHPPLMHRFGDWMDRPLPAFRTALATAAPSCRLVPVTPGTWTDLAGDGGRTA